MWGFYTHHAAAWYGLIAFSLLIITQVTVAAADGGIRLEDAVDRTLESNPQLVAFGYQIQAQQGRLTQARIKPSAELGLVVENALGSGDYDGVDGAETTLSLGWVLERGKREAYVGAAHAGVVRWRHKRKSIAWTSLPGPLTCFWKIWNTRSVCACRMRPPLLRSRQSQLYAS